jgi:hypothetical protein
LKTKGSSTLNIWRCLQSTTQFDKKFKHKNDERLFHFVNNKKKGFMEVNYVPLSVQKLAIKALNCVLMKEKKNSQ